MLGNFCSFLAATSVNNADTQQMLAMAVHKKIRNFVCDECGYAASGKNNLTSHIKGVHQKNFRLLNLENEERDDSM